MQWIQIWDCWVKPSTTYLHSTHQAGLLGETWLSYSSISNIINDTTLCPKKGSHLMFHTTNYCKCGPIFKILPPTDSWEYSLCTHYKDFRFLVHILKKNTSIHVKPNPFDATWRARFIQAAAQIHILDVRATIFKAVTWCVKLVQYSIANRTRSN